MKLSSDVIQRQGVKSNYSYLEATKSSEEMRLKAGFSLLLTEPVIVGPGNIIDAIKRNYPDWSDDCKVLAYDGYNLAYYAEKIGPEEAVKSVDLSNIVLRIRGIDLLLRFVPEPAPILIEEDLIQDRLGAEWRDIIRAHKARVEIIPLKWELGYFALQSAVSMLLLAEGLRSFLHSFSASPIWIFAQQSALMMDSRTLATCFVGKEFLLPAQLLVRPFKVLVKDTKDFLVFHSRGLEFVIGTEFFVPSLKDDLDAELKVFDELARRFYAQGFPEDGRLGSVGHFRNAIIAAPVYNDQFGSYGFGIQEAVRPKVITFNDIFKATPWFVKYPLLAAHLIAILSLIEPKILMTIMSPFP